VTLLVFVELLASSIWVGGLVAIAVAAHSARAELGPTVQIAFFRTLGRSYLRIGGGALLVSLACGFALLLHGPWSTEKTLAIVVAALLVLATAAGVFQAKALSRLRLATLSARTAPRVARSARRANLLRGTIGLLTVVEFALAAGFVR
jgi:hypothetical protein